MLLKNIFLAKFIERKNRFVGEGILDGKKIQFHIGDTGRLKELLMSGNEILVQKMPSDGRKYPFRLIAAKGLEGDFILLNSLLHSALVREYLKNKNISYQAEVVVGDSKIDFYIENIGFVEVKGCSLIKEINGDFVGMFPDAPTIRGQKHIKELIQLAKQGKKAEIWFLLTNDVGKFKPNVHTDQVFSNLFYEFLNSGGKVRFLYAKLVFDKNQVMINIKEKNLSIIK